LITTSSTAFHLPHAKYQLRWKAGASRNSRILAAVGNRKKDAATVSYPSSQLSSRIQQDSTRCIFTRNIELISVRPKSYAFGIGLSEQVTFRPGLSVSAGVSESKMLHFGPAAVRAHGPDPAFGPASVISPLGGWPTGTGPSAARRPRTRTLPRPRTCAGVLPANPAQFSCHDRMMMDAGPPEAPHNGDSAAATEWYNLIYYIKYFMWNTMM
jgi:hypothetical protein